MDKQILNKKIFLAVLVSFFALFIIITGVFLLTKKGKKTQLERLTTSSPIISPTTAVSTKGFLKLTEASGLTSFSLNQPVTLQVLADSAGEEIVGFDVLVGYDSTAFDFIKASSLLADFKVYFYKREGYVILTMIKSLKSKTPSVFRETPVLTFNFLPKKRGRFSFEIKEKIGRETTGLVNNKTKKITPRLDQLTVEIY
ncbi:MAG: hypothetical protein ACK4FL_03830 [Microgenomates group bacterium]